MDMGPTKAQEKASFEGIWGTAHLIMCIGAFALLAVKIFKSDAVDLNQYAIAWFGAYCGSQYMLSKEKLKKEKTNV